MSSLLSLIIGTVVGLTQFRIKRLLAYSTIVRRCATMIHEVKDFTQCSRLCPAAELGEGESPTLNLAFPVKWLIRLNQLCRLVTRAEFPMIKAKLLKVYLKGSSAIGIYLDWNRVGGYKWIILIVWSIVNWPSLGITNTSKSEKGRSKGNMENLGTSGLPKVWKNHGNRGIIVPSANQNWQSIGPKDPVASGRVPGQRYHSSNSSAGVSSTVRSDDTRRLRWLEENCIKDNRFIAQDIYKLMYIPALYEKAYYKIKSKPGNMTPGITPTTLDGFSSEVISDLIRKLKDESFQFSPGRRVSIPKSSGGSRPLTIAPPRDKIVQEVMRMILAAIFEPSFSPNSHGFRSGRSCHSALKQVFTTFGVASWYIEGDISKSFDSFDHGILMEIIGKRIKDDRFLRLIRKSLNAGYFEFNKYKHSISGGTPQGSIISPILCNIYLNELDRFIEKLSQEFNVGTKAKGNPIWISYRNKKVRSQTITEKVKWHKLMLTVPSKDPLDPNFNKIVYVRYADDWILGVRGSYNDCTDLLETIKTFLSEELKLNLSESKTLITNANKGKALFLSTQIFRARHQSLTRLRSFNRRAGREIRMMIPMDKITKKLRETNFMKNGIATPRFLWMHNSKDQIIALYNSVYRGIINYYSFAHNLGKVSGFLHMILKSSCAKLLATKFSLRSQKQIFTRYGKNLRGPDRLAFADAVYKIRAWDFRIAERSNPNDVTVNGLIKTLYAETISIASLEGLTCSICDSNHRVEMHHVRKMKDLNPKLSKIDALMVKRRRKQIPLCRACHMKHHATPTITR